MNRYQSPSSARLLLLPLLALVLNGCPVEDRAAPPPPPLPQRLSWEGQPPQEWTVDSSDSGTDPALPVAGATRHTVIFPGGDTLHLVEFPRDYQAYRIFQAQAAPEEIRRGFYRSGSRLHFFHGRYLGTLPLAVPGLVPASYLQERLSIQGEDLFLRPAVFESFPVSGQIPHTERVVSPEFLGPGGEEEVFLMRYQCRGDTALLFRGFPSSPERARSWPRAWKGSVDTLQWGREMRFSGYTELDRPLEFWIFKGGYVGVEGCFDSVLAREYAEKMRKMTVLLNKP